MTGLGPRQPDAGQPGPTVSHLLGEMTWLLSQSPLHRGLRIADLEWLVMPVLVNRQFYLFRDGERPVGLALWARCNAAAAAKLERGLVEPGNQLTLEDWTSGDEVWLVDLVAPFATNQNRQRELMFADLVSGPLRDQAFRFHRTDPNTGKRAVETVDADTGSRLQAALGDAIGRA